MSVRMMSKVWDHSQQKDGALLVLLALADFADDDGFCWPSISTLARKSRLSDRQVQRVLRALESDGEIELHGNRGRANTNQYRVVPGLKKEAAKPDNMTPSKGDKMPGVTKCRGDIGDIEKVTSATIKGDTHVTQTIRNRHSEPSRHTESIAVEIHGARPKSQTPPDDEFPPPLPDGPLPGSESQNGLTGSEAHLRPLFAAFRSVRHPKCIPENPPPAEWKSALPWLRLLYEAGASVETVRVATAAALRRWRTPDMVTIKAVAEKWTGLLEPDAAPVEAAPPLRETATQKARRESLERIDRNFEQQVQTYREWEAGSGSPPPGDDSLPMLRIVGGAKA